MEKVRARDTLADLLVGERQAKEEIAARKELELKMHCRNDLRRQMEHDFEEKQRREKVQKKIDEEFLQEQMRFLAERDKLDQLSDEKRRRKQMEHRRALLEAFDEKKRVKAEHMCQQIHKRDRRLKAAQALYVQLIHFCELSLLIDFLFLITANKKSRRNVFAW